MIRTVFDWDLMCRLLLLSFKGFVYVYGRHSLEHVVSGCIWANSDVGLELGAVQSSDQRNEYH